MGILVEQGMAVEVGILVEQGMVAEVGMAVEVGIPAVEGTGLQGRVEGSLLSFQQRSIGRETQEKEKEGRGQ